VSPAKSPARRSGARKGARAQKSPAPRKARPDAPRILVLRAAGTNCDRETAFAFEQAGAETHTIHVNRVLARPAHLLEAHGLAIPGGFSFGDDLGAGTIFGTSIRTRLIDGIRRLVDRGGIVLGICNGFQVLAKTGLVPGFDGEVERSVTLASNTGNRYEDRWVTLEVTTEKSVFLRRGERYHVPVAHGEGRLLPESDAVRRRLHADGQVALRYVGPDGGHPAPYPYNPNGAIDDIAGITDPTGRILGLMPHPERHQFPWQSPRFHRGEAPSVPDGLRLFQHAVEHLKRTF
jgi:phosphoribosylformylglycinamidine synthase subunit PurQ / glutaminase